MRQGRGDRGEGRGDKTYWKLNRSSEIEDGSGVEGSSANDSCDYVNSGTASGSREDGLHSESILRFSHGDLPPINHICEGITEGTGGG